MDVVDLGRNVDRMLQPVTAAIYQNGVEKPAMRRTFEIAIGAISDQHLWTEDIIFSNSTVTTYFCLTCVTV